MSSGLPSLARSAVVAWMGLALLLSCAQDSVGAEPPFASAKPQTPADIINSRGFWDDIPPPANQASPGQVAALRARQVLAATTDPQPTASIADSFNRAMAYAPAATSPVDRANVVTASAPMPPYVPASERGGGLAVGASTAHAIAVLPVLPRSRPKRSIRPRYNSSRPGRWNRQ